MIRSCTQTSPRFAATDSAKVFERNPTSAAMCLDNEPLGNLTVPIAAVAGFTAHQGFQFAPDSLRASPQVFASSGLLSARLSSVGRARQAPTSAPLYRFR
ncbi:protein of unknown function [Methylocaldum szegediense]|uniref:Uncharacterized protein n=1 Tax=Methylocaldum szegediense TaxID=73780 RepID=A0ABN8WZQ0_9GAMM|nr:protein of unknown function [Methylocaldum szegediense]